MVNNSQSQRPYNVFDMINSDKLALHMQFGCGFGPKLVLLHGLGASGRYWLAAADLLKAKYHIASYDLLGFGGSPKPDDFEYFRWQQADALRQALWNDKIIGKINLVGHSMGALVALDFAKRYPNKINKLVLSNMPVMLSKADGEAVRKRYADKLPKIEKSFSHKAEHHGKNKKVADEHKVFQHYDLAQLSPYAYAQAIKNSPRDKTILDNLERLRFPIYIINTDNDKALIPANSKLLAGKLPDGHIINAKGSHQFPVLDPKRFSEIISAII